LSSYKTTLKQQLNGENQFSFFHCLTVVSVSFCSLLKGIADYVFVLSNEQPFYFILLF